MQSKITLRHSLQDCTVHTHKPTCARKWMLRHFPPPTPGCHVGCRLCYPFARTMASMGLAGHVLRGPRRLLHIGPDNHFFVFEFCGSNTFRRRFGHTSIVFIEDTAADPQFVFCLPKIVTRRRAFQRLSPKRRPKQLMPKHYLEALNTFDCMNR